MFITQAFLKSRVQELGQKIYEDLGKMDLTFLSISPNSWEFAFDLSQSVVAKNLVLQVPQEPTAKWFLEHEMYWDNICVLVQDVSDTGETLQNHLILCRQFLNMDILTVTLLQKKSTIPQVYQPDYIGFSIPNEFVVGYGMGLRGKFNDLPHIAIYAP